MRDFEDWKRDQLKNIKVRAAYSALGEEFAQARKKIAAQKKKRVPVCATSTKKAPTLDRAKRK
jgi:hypothetical protein